jgi:hypothetical protein
MEYGVGWLATITSIITHKEFFLLKILCQVTKGGNPMISGQKYGVLIYSSKKE